MKAFEEWKKEQQEKKREISADELMSAAAHVVCSDELVKGLVKVDPTLIFTIPVIVGRISQVLFDETEETEKGVTE